MKGKECYTLENCQRVLRDSREILGVLVLAKKREFAVDFGTRGKTQPPEGQEKRVFFFFFFIFFFFFFFFFFFSNVFHRICG